MNCLRTVALLLLPALPLTAQTPAFTLFGQGCNPAGTAIEAQRWDPGTAAWVPSPPRIGRPFGVRVPRQAGELVPLCILGRSNIVFMGQPLPLTVFFRQRLYPVTYQPEYGPCLLVGPDLVVPGSGQASYWTFSAPLPPDPSLVGLSLFMQWALYYRQSFTMPNRPPLLAEEGIRWSRGARMTFGI